MAYRRTARVEERLAATRDALVRAATAQVSRSGWRGVTVAGVARGAGVATGTVYGHFADKADLCAEVFRRAAGRELAQVAAAVGQRAGGDAPAAARGTRDGDEGAAATRSAADRCAAALRTFAERALESPRLAYALLAEPADPVVEAERLKHRAGHRAVFREVLDDGIARGELAPCDTEILAAVLVGGLGEALVGPLAPVRARRARKGPGQNSLAKTRGTRRLPGKARGAQRSNATQATSNAARQDASALEWQDYSDPGPKSTFVDDLVADCLRALPFRATSPT